FLIISQLSAQTCDLGSGDINLDGSINMADILPFQDLLNNLDYLCEADGNLDGSLDLLDVGPIYETLLEQQTSVFVDSTTEGPGDFFWSTEGLGGDSPNQPLFVDIYPDMSIRLYLYYTVNHDAGDLVAGAAINVATSRPGVVRFEEAGWHNFDILFDDQFSIAPRWNNEWPIDQAPGYYPATSVSDELVIGLTGSNLIGGWGLNSESTTGNDFVDAGYSEAANAFLFGEVQLKGLQPGGDVTLQAGPNRLGAANGYELVDVDVASARIHIILPGDVNRDGSVNLLDVAPFVGLLETGEYQTEADINYDGVFNLLDVAPFIQVLSGE
ncbi:MAG: dockerin type I domain-containing protein, partial [Planctomycetota bacterium]